MALHSPFLSVNPNKSIATNMPAIIPHYGAENSLSRYAECISSPVRSPLQMSYFPSPHARPMPTTATVIDGLVRMEEVAIASRLAMHLALARLGATAAAQ